MYFTWSINKSGALSLLCILYIIIFVMLPVICNSGWLPSAPVYSLQFAVTWRHLMMLESNSDLIHQASENKIKFEMHYKATAETDEVFPWK